MTWGTTTPIVLLPKASRDWTEKRLEAVMLHKLAHVRRWDCASQLMTAAVCALYWFNPLVWLGARAMRAEAELATDDMVLRSGVKPSAYAGELLRLAAELGRQRQPFEVVGVSIMKHSKIESRVVAILDNSRRRRGIGSLEAITTLGVAILLSTLVGVVRPAISQEGQATAPAVVAAPPLAPTPPMPTAHAETIEAPAPPVVPVHPYAAGTKNLEQRRAGPKLKRGRANKGMSRIGISRPRIILDRASVNRQWLQSHQEKLQSDILRQQKTIQELNLQIQALQRQNEKAMKHAELHQEESLTELKKVQNLVELERVKQLKFFPAVTSKDLLTRNDVRPNEVNKRFLISDRALAESAAPVSQAGRRQVIASSVNAPLENRSEGFGFRIVKIFEGFPMKISVVLDGETATRSVMVGENIPGTSWTVEGVSNDFPGNKRSVYLKRLRDGKKFVLTRVHVAR
jgi:hypothetical protein